MISFRGRTKFIVYDSSKPTKWGYRPYVLSDKKTGYTISMKLLQNLEENEENIYEGLDIDSVILLILYC